MIILVINCGSSSIKYQLLDMKNDDVFDIIAKGIAEKIGLPAVECMMVKELARGALDRIHGVVDYSFYEVLR